MSNISQENTIFFLQQFTRATVEIDQAYLREYETLRGEITFKIIKLQEKILDDWNNNLDKYDKPIFRCSTVSAVVDLNKCDIYFEEDIDDYLYPKNSKLCPLCKVAQNAQSK